MHRYIVRPARDATPSAEYNSLMSTLLPEQALFLRDTVLRALQAELPVTQRVIEAIPLDKSAFRMDEVGKSALDLAWHIVAAEHKFMDLVVTGTFDVAPSPRPAHLDTSSAIARWFGETAAEDHERVAAAPAEALAKVVDFRGRFKFPAVAFLQIGLNHSIHHRGQLSMYLRPMGAKVPAIYGESYDSAQARKESA
jgi:uncharacterized damage-inducible protein DinB